MTDYRQLIVDYVKSARAMWHATESDDDEFDRLQEAQDAIFDKMCEIADGEPTQPIFSHRESTAAERIGKPLIDVLGDEG